MDDSGEVGQGKNGTQQQDLLPHWPVVQRIKFEHDCVEIRLAKKQTLLSTYWRNSVRKRAGNSYAD